MSTPDLLSPHGRSVGGTLPNLNRSARRARNLDRMWGILLPIAVFLVGGFIWQLQTADSRSLIVPTFTETLAGVYELFFVDGEIWSALATSNQAFVLGYAISVLAGVPIGLALARSRLLDDAANPYVSMWLALPTAPLIPLVLMALGLGLSSRVAVVVIFALVYIIINTRAGVRSVDDQLVEMARAFGGTERQIWRRILLPGASPAILAGLRLGMARAIDGMIVAELLLVAVGIGNLFLRYRSSYQGGLMFAAVIAVAIEASILITLMRGLERKLTPWV